MKKYNEDENNFLRSNYENMSYEQMAIALNRTVGSIHSKLFKLGLKSKKKTFVENGDRVGRLTVIERSSKIDKNGCRYHICRCDCGKIIETRSNGLSRRKRKPVQSCGCLTTEKRQEKHRLIAGESSYNRLERDYRKSAKIRNLVYSLTKEEFRFLVSQNCYWCGEIPRKWNYYFNSKVELRDKNTRISLDWAHQQWININGIDRMDNSSGYILKNCVSCCPDCNELKSNRTAQEFLDRLNKIINFQKKRS